MSASVFSAVFLPVMKSATPSPAAAETRPMALVEG